MKPFILIIFDRYDAEASTHEVVYGESAQDVYLNHIKAQLSEDYEDEDLQEELEYSLENNPLKEGEEGLWGLDYEEQSLLIIAVPNLS